MGNGESVGVGVGDADNANRWLVARWFERRTAKIEEDMVDDGDEVFERRV